MKFQLITIGLILLLGCKSNSPKEILGNKVIIPNSLIFIKNTQQVSLLTDQNPEKKLKLVCNVDIGCDECIKHLNTWQNFVDSLQSVNIPTTVICTTDDTAYLKHQILPKVKTKALFLADVKQSYYFSNKQLFTLPNLNYKILLLDENDCIQMYGDPFLHNSTKNIYLYVINKFLKENKQPFTMNWQE